jgi:hypothetical protein
MVTQESRGAARQSVLAQIPRGILFTLRPDIDEGAGDDGEDLLYWVGDLIDYTEEGDRVVVATYSMPDWYHRCDIEWG